LIGTTRRLPLVVFQEEEKAHLLPWDGEPYEVPDWHTVTVHPDHHIAYRYALYSAPYSTCPPGIKLEVKGDSKLMQLYHKGVLVKIHPPSHVVGALQIQRITRSKAHRLHPALTQLP
jgi:hypothetical protein